jgi:hypothetical protein
MEKYIGLKLIQATPKKRKVEDHDEVHFEDGYKVVYEDGYESWSPKEVFEKAYHTYQNPFHRNELTDDLRKYPTPQKDGMTTEYPDGIRLFGSWSSRIEQWKDQNLHRIPKGF